MSEPVLTEIALADMTQSKWNSLSPAERTRLEDSSNLTSQLHTYLRCRVEAVRHTGEVVRFWVERSTGWRPIYLEIKTSRSLGGSPADKSYRTIRFIRNRD